MRLRDETILEKQLHTLSASKHSSQKARTQQQTANRKKTWHRSATCESGSSWEARGSRIKGSKRPRIAREQMTTFWSVPKGFRLHLWGHAHQPPSSHVCAGSQAVSRICESHIMFAWISSSRVNLIKQLTHYCTVGTVPGTNYIWIGISYVSNYLQSRYVTWESKFISLCEKSCRCRKKRIYVTCTRETINNHTSFKI